jgi:phenylacetate-CoA ligase
VSARALLFLLRSYLCDRHRLRRSAKHIERYRRQAFARVLRQAAATPLYQDLYRDIDLSRITLDTIDELPILTKRDLRRHFPEGAVPKGFDTRSGHIVSTSGSTGEPTSVYTDLEAIARALVAFLRELEACGMTWRARMSIIVDLAPRAIEEAYLVKGLPFTIRNIQLLDVAENPASMLAKIERFNPVFIGGYPGVLQALARLKRQGNGASVSPKMMASSGAVLDDYTRSYISEAFGAPLVDTYGSTEAGPVAFECLHGKYHVHHDMLHLEFLDENNIPVEPGNPGKIVVTKLYGNATPILRYDGLNDFVVPLDGRCSCGLNTPLIQHVAGRTVDALVMPSGALIPPFAITGIPAKVMERLASDAIRQFRIVQEDPVSVDVRVCLNPDSPDREAVLRALEEEFQKKMERGVGVNVKEVAAFDNETPVPRVVRSKVSFESRRP